MNTPSSTTNGNVLTPNTPSPLPTIFPADSPWRQRIDNAPVAANSAAIMARIASLYGNQQIRADFSQNIGDHRVMYGLPYNIVHGNTAPKVKFVLSPYANESDPVEVPMPENPVIESDYQDGPNPDVASRQDSHLIIWDVDNNVVHEMFMASRPSENPDGKWHAAQQSVWDLKTNSFRRIGWTSADAAGLPILPGLCRPDEGLPIDKGGKGVIDHAIRVTLRNPVILNKYVYPASHVANYGNNDASAMPPMGSRLRLKASVDISKMKPQSKVIAQAMKTYGMIVADNGANFFFSGSNYATGPDNRPALTWDNDDIHDSVLGIKSLKYDDFEFVDMTPSVSGVSPAIGAPGWSVDVAGLGFSGAAGRLNVYFGSAQSPKVEYVSDGRLRAVVPDGVGSVAVRVISGIPGVVSDENYTPPFWGYGRSPLGQQCVFTYGVPVNSAGFIGVQASSAIVGSEGSQVVAGATILPAYAAVAGIDHSSYVWSGGTSDPRALRKSPTATDRIAACWYGNQFAVDVNLTDGKPHRFSLYAIDWDRLGRSQRIDVIDALTGAVLDSQVVADFGPGKYLSWTIRGHVQFVVTRVSGVNAVVSGLFFDPSN